VKSKDNKKINFKEESLLSKTSRPSPCQEIGRLYRYSNLHYFIHFTICYLL